MTGDSSSAFSVSSGDCAVNCSNDNEVFAFHTGGANIAMVDGSVRFLKDGTPQRVLEEKLIPATIDPFGGTGMSGTALLDAKDPP